MPSPPTHFTQYEGREVSLKEYAALTGTPYGTVYKRHMKSQPLDGSGSRRTGRPKSNMNKPEAPYTFEELIPIYKCFAGTVDKDAEIHMLMDFSCLPYLKAEALREDLIYEIERRRVK
ncbi:MAG: hypothetical protein IJG15_04940 [Lachnospiraceae bacterium]|nr:hypothetical protein [Lachnospiraceae bacterium]